MKRMQAESTRISITDIVFDEAIYPRKGIDLKRVNIFAENMRDGFAFDPIEVESVPENPGKYRLLDGVHRWNAYKAVGEMELASVVRNLNGEDPLLYAAQKAIGPRQLTEDESRDTARRAYNRNPQLTASEIGKAIGRAQRTVNEYIADLRAVNQVELNLKIYLMYKLGMPQERIAKRLGMDQKTIHYHLGKMAEPPFSLNSDLKAGFTVAQVSEKHGWPEPLVWSLALEGKTDLERFKELGWGLRTWDVWDWNDCDKRFGDKWPGQIPAQLIAHILYYFSEQNYLVFDPMAGGGVTPDTCLALNRRCWAFDMVDRPDTRPEIECHHWDFKNDCEPINSKEKPDLVILDPPYFAKKAEDYHGESISGLSKKDYLDFFKDFFLYLKKISKKSTKLAFINADWRDFQGTPAIKEGSKESILFEDYLDVFRQTGWRYSHFIQAPMSSQRFSAVVVSAMQKKKILGVTSRYVIILSQHP